MLIRRLLSVNFYTFWVVMMLNYYPNKVGLAEIGFICIINFLFFEQITEVGYLTLSKLTKKKTTKSKGNYKKYLKLVATWCVMV